MEARTRHMAELPFSLIESEILPRIQAKSDIGRCRCVCKQWKSFLSTPTFARMHLQTHRTINDYKLLILDEHRLNLTTIPYHPNSDVFILASLDGLVCLASMEVPTKLVFWNPLTGVHRKLSCTPMICFFSIDVIGFYKNSSNDYKLVHFVSGGDLGTYIYSHRLDSWRKIKFSWGEFAVRRWSPATFWGQSLYFTVRAYRHWCVICFDVETETTRKISFPTIPDTTDYSGSLVILNGCIHLCVSYSISINRKWLKQGELWRMDGDGDGGWVKVAAFSDTLPIYKEFTRPHICTESIGNWVVVLDQENNSLKKVNMEDFTTHHPYIFFRSWEYRSSRIIYVETLVSPVNP